MIHAVDTSAQPARGTAAKRLEPEPIGALTWLLVAVALVPIVVAIVRVLTGPAAGFHATSDNALNELLVRDVGRHPVLLGPYSRDAWSHPGPLFSYVSAIPYRLLGSRSSAMLADALIINGLAIGVTITVAKRWGGLVFAIPVVLLEALLITSLPLGFLEDPWNPFVTVLPFGAFLMVAWAATCGDRWAYPVAALIGTFCAQTHVGYTSLVVAVLAWCGWRAWRDRDTNGLVGWWWAAGTLGLLWFAPLVEQLIHSPGNFRTTFHYFRTTTEPAHSIADGLKVMAAQFSLVPDWLVGLRGVSPFSGEPAALGSTPVPVLLVPFGVVVALVIRSDDRRKRRLVAVLLIPLVVGVVTLAQTVGPMYEYRLRWIWVLAGLCVTFTIAHAAQMLGHHTTRNRGRPVLVVCVAATVVFGAFGVARVTSYERPDAGGTKTLSALSTAVLRQLPDRPGVVVLNAKTFLTSKYLAGLVLAMEQAGVRVKIHNRSPLRESFSDHRRYDHEPLRARLLIASNREIEAAAARSGARPIAYVSSISRARRASALRAFKRLIARGVTGYDRRLGELSKALVATAVFSLPISAGPRPAQTHSRP